MMLDNIQIYCNGTIPPTTQPPTTTLPPTTTTEAPTTTTTAAPTTTTAFTCSYNQPCVIDIETIGCCRDNICLAPAFQPCIMNSQCISGLCQTSECTQSNFQGDCCTDSDCVFPYVCNNGTCGNPSCFSDGQQCESLSEVPGCCFNGSCLISGGNAGCNIDSDCISQDCHNGICINSFVNDSCCVDTDCMPNLYCLNSTCQRRPTTTPPPATTGTTGTPAMTTGTTGIPSTTGTTGIPSTTGTTGIPTTTTRAPTTTTNHSQCVNDTSCENNAPMVTEDPNCPNGLTCTGVNMTCTCNDCDECTEDKCVVALTEDLMTWICKCDYRILPNCSLSDFDRVDPTTRAPTTTREESTGDLLNEDSENDVDQNSSSNLNSVYWTLGISLGVCIIIIILVIIFLLYTRRKYTINSKKIAKKLRKNK